MAEDFGEPWAQLDGCIKRNDGVPVTYYAGAASRIVACVNACKGLPTAFLERKATTLDSLKRPDWFEDALYREAAGCFRNPDKEAKFATVATWLIDLARRPEAPVYVEDMLLHTDLEPEEEAVRYCVNWLTSKGFSVTKDET